MINIEHFTFNAFQTRCSIVWDKDNNCAFVDPGAYGTEEHETLTSFVSSKGLKPVCIMLTHCHFDHIYGVAGLAREYDIPVYMHKDEAFTLEKTNSYVCQAFGLPMPDPFTTEDIQVSHIAGTDSVEVGSLHFEVLETPGHTAGGVCYLEREEKVLFCGDTIFAGAIGRTDHPGGDYDQIMKSIFEKLMCLEGEVVVIPGHGPETDIATERMTNPFLMPFNEPYEE